MNRKNLVAILLFSLPVLSWIPAEGFMVGGEIHRAKALMDGLYQVEGDMSLLLKLGELFHAPPAS